MRTIIVLLLLVGCSTRPPLKYKYSSAASYLASMTPDDVVVSKVEGELREPALFASGMDSTFLYVKLYDSHGNLLDNVDPKDLTLSSNRDIEAKPFVLKQGVYKAEIRPRVKSKKILMRVDWQEKVLSSDIHLNAGIEPLKASLIPMPKDMEISKNYDEISVSPGRKYAETSTEGFAIENLGDNQIVNDKKYKNGQRIFNFDYLEHARQNIALEVDDATSSSLSQGQHSIFVFFPRKNLPVVEQLSGTIDVTLPTGEKMIFQKNSKEIVDGVFKEGPLDRKTFPDLRYQGKGVVLRANGRGQSPQFEQSGEKIDMEFGLKGTSEALIINGSTGEKCRRPKTDFWEALDVSPIEFKFATDEEFDAYLKKNCNFGLPKL